MMRKELLKMLPSDANLIPEAAQRVFQGTLFDVYQWPQTMFDGSVRTFEMLRRPDTVQAMVVRDGELLLVREEQPSKQPQVHFPGGRADGDGEDWLTAAKRELLEETGLTCAQWRLVDVVQPQSKIEWFGATFLATDITSKSEPSLDGGERIEPFWLPFDAARERILSGEERSLHFLMPLFSRIPTLEALLSLPELHAVKTTQK